MSSKALDMSMSLDGFVAGPSERLDNGPRDGGARLPAKGAAQSADSASQGESAESERLAAKSGPGVARSAPAELSTGPGGPSAPLTRDESKHHGFHVRR